MNTEPEKKSDRDLGGGDTTWGIPPGHHVYGYHHGTPPPDLLKPWNFNPQPAGDAPAHPPHQGHSVQHQPTPQREAPPHQHQHHHHQQHHHAVPAHQVAQQTAPPQQEPQGWAPPDPRYLPPPLGPALTPDERMEQLRSPGGENGNHPGP